jgi:ribosomal protein S15P/S13E
MNWAILPSCCRTLTAAALLLGLGFWLIPVSGWANALGSADLDQIRQRYFMPSQPESQVREIAWGGQNYYVIRVSALDLFDEGNRSRIQQRLELLGKSALLKYLGQKFPGTTSASLRYYRLGLLWKEAKYSYGLFYVQQNHVNIPHQTQPKPLPLSPTPKTATPNTVQESSIVESTSGEASTTPAIEPLDPDDLHRALNAEITRLEEHLKTKPDDLSAWESLKGLYQQIGDLDNLNRVLDEILKLKGKVGDDTPKTNFQ